MNRKYTVEKYLDTVNKIKRASDDISITSDIIVGFPGETDADFEQTMKLCEECDFAWVHAFPYSERPGTAAAEMKNKVPQSVSGERAKRLTEWAIVQKIKYIESFINTEHEAVLETVRRPLAVAANKTSRFICHAVTDNFIHCEIVSDKQIETNKSVKIRITGVLSERIKKGGDIEASSEFV